MVLLAGLGYIVARPLLRPSEGAVVKVVPLAPQAEPAVVDTIFEGKHVRLTLPEAYELQPPKQPAANNLEGYLFIRSGIGRKILTVTVTSLPSGKLEDDTSYQSRKLRPETYKQKVQTIRKESVTVSFSPGTDQRVGFWPHGGKLLTLSLSGVAPGSESDVQEFQAILESVIWK